jgi:hypothetical protein
MVEIVVTRQLATTCVLKQYSRGEEIKNTNRTHTRVTATKRWRRMSLIKIVVVYGSRRRLLVLSCFLECRGRGGVIGALGRSKAWRVR